MKYHIDISIQTLCSGASIGHDHFWDVSTSWLESICGKFNWLDIIWAGTHLFICRNIYIYIYYIHESRCAKLVTSYWRRLEAVITAKGASTKYWVKDLNTYVNVIFQFFIFNKFAKISKILFSLCHYRVLSVD